ncbi:tripartite tricarboxylate transporter substrate-binding protein [Variovorax fucosicus]|uniref:tripartite tricarboxylate transporter substrate-binding protein n=1 Tax=Variovorax fucosicus TaxID=3053517 RepID=UPI0033654FFE
MLGPASGRLQQAGASGNLGGQQVATAALDGHTLLMAISTFTMTPAIYKEMPSDAVADFAPVSMSQKMPNSVSVQRSHLAPAAAHPEDGVHLFFGGRLCIPNTPIAESTVPSSRRGSWPNAGSPMHRSRPWPSRTA